MTRQLCEGMPAEWWDVADDGARLAMAICRRCPSQVSCPEGDPTPYGVVRAGAPFTTAGTLLDACLTCGYPNLGGPMNRAGRCQHCDLPPLSRWRIDIERMAAAGLNNRQIGERLGATRLDVKGARSHWNRATK